MALAKNHELDWLPPGWKVEENVKNGRKVRCFINVKSSQRLYSKASVLRQIRKSKTNNQRSHSQSSNGPLTRSLRNKEIPIPTDKMPTEKIPTEPLTRSLRNKEILIPMDKMPTEKIPTEPNDCHDLLPPGWITEVKTRKGGVRAGEDYKTYTELSTGKMFYSKPEVTRYLKGKEQRTGSSERKKSGATGSVRILRRHKPDQGEEVNPHPKFDEGKREEVPQHPKSDGSVRILRRHKPGQGEEVNPHAKSDEGKKEEVPQHPKLDEQKTEEVPQDQKFDEGKREMGPQHPKHDKRRKEEVPQHPKFDEGKAKEVSQHFTLDKRKEEEVPQHPKFDEEPWQIVIASPCVRKKENWPQHPKLDKRKKEEVPQHPKLDKRQKEEVPQHPKVDDGKREEVPQDPNFDEGKTQPEVPLDPKFDEGKTQQEVPQDPKFDEGKNQPSKKRKVIVETVIAEGLPPGWIKEIRIKESSNGLRKDPFYTNPTSGYVFRSRLEVLRYLETGEISRHAYKRRDSGMNTIQSTQESPSDSTVTSNTTEDSIKRQLFTGKKNPKRSSFSNCGYSKAGNNALLDLGADVDTIPIETQMPKGNETDVVRIDTDPTSSSKDIFLEKKREDSNKANTLSVETKSANILSENEFPGVERSKDKEETGQRSSKSTERESKGNGKKIDSSRRSSKRLAGIEIEHVTHSLPIERILRSANKRFDKSEVEQSQKVPPVTNVGSQEETVCHYNSESAIEFFQDEQSKDKKECGKQSPEKKPKRNRKKTFEGIEVEPETHSLPSRRVLRSAIRASTKTEAVPSLGSNQGEQAQEVPQVINVGSQEEIVCHNAEPATLPSKNELLGAEQIKDKEEYAKKSSGRKPKRSRKQIFSPHWSSKLLAGIEGESFTHSMAKQRVIQSARTEAMPSSGSEQGEQARETPLGVNLQEEIVPAASIFPEEQTTKASSRSNNTHQTMMIDFSRNTIGGQTTVEPSRNSFADQMFKEPPKINSKERFSTDELTNGRGKAQQDSPFSFPWSDPCIEFAYKTLTGALPLDDNIAIQDYVQHQIHTCSNSSNNFTLQDSRPPGFSLNTVPSNSSNSITFPDPGPPGFSRGSAPSKRNDNFALPEARPPGFPRNTAPSNSGNNPTFPDATPPGFSFNAAPSNRGNNLTLTDAMPPGFSLNDAPSDCGNNIAFPDAMPPGFSLNDVPSSCGNNIAFPDATPPGFSLNDAPYHGNNIAFPDSTPPGFSLNDVPSTQGYNITFPDSGPPGFSRSSVPSNSSNNPAIPDGTPPGFTRSSIPSNRNDNFALPQSRAPGSSQSSVLSNRSNNFPIPDARSPGFSRSSVPSNSNDHFALPDARPPGFSLNSVPSNSNNDHFALPDARPPGFSQSSVPPNSNNDHFALPDARPPGFSLNSVPSNSNNDHFALPDARPPGFSRSSVPPNSNNDHFAIPYARPPGFSQSSAPSNSNYDHFAIPDAKPPGFSRSSIPSNSNNDNFALPDARRTGFPCSSNEPSNSPWCSSEPSNSGNNPAHPDANPPGFSWSGFPLDNGINLNVAFTDEGPPGFSEKIVPSSKQQQQDINPAGSRTQATDFPFQGTFFSSWNRN